MTEQLSLDGFGTSTAPTDRIFFAVFPDASARLRIGDLAQQRKRVHGLKGQPIALDRSHVTLFHLGDHLELRADIVTAARAAAESLVAAPFDVAFDRVASFRGRARNLPFVLRTDEGAEGIAALMTFQKTLGEALKKNGLARWVGTQFTPHVTLMYDDEPVAEQLVDPIGWTVNELVLVHSLLGRKQHVSLARWPLLS